MSTVHFHPVWDQQLTKNEKIQYIQKADSIYLPKGSFSVTPLLTKYKRNGGLVATVSFCTMVFLILYSYKDKL